MNPPVQSCEVPKFFILPKVEKGQGEKILFCLRLKKDRAKKFYFA